MWGFVFQGKAYEGLTCNALEWVDSFGGGTIVETDGKITINNPKAAEALDWAATLIGTISPEGVLNYSEEEARGVFQSGNAVFMRNWPYAWALGAGAGQPGQGQVRRGGAAEGRAGRQEHRRRSAAGSSRSRSTARTRTPRPTSSVPDLEPRSRSGARSRAPTTRPIAALYKDPEMLTAVPFFGSLYEVFTNAVARPSR